MKKSILISCLLCACMLFTSVTFASDVGKDKVPKTEKSSITNDVFVVDYAVIVPEQAIAMIHFGVEAKSVAHTEIAISKTETGNKNLLIPYSMAYSCSCTEKLLTYKAKNTLEKTNANPYVLIEVWKDKIKQCRYA